MRISAPQRGLLAGVAALFVLSASSTLAAAPALWPQYTSPFRPGQVVDYEMTVVSIRKTFPAGPYQQRILRHGHWVLIETDQENGHRRRSFLNERSNTTADLTTGPRGQFINIWRGGNASRISSHPGLRPVKLKQTDRLLGETCQVWDVWRRTDERTGKVTTRRLACVTADGIQLWWKDIHPDYEGESGRAISLVRRRVSPDEVRLPANLFTRGRLLAVAAKAPRDGGSWVPDHEVRYEGTMGASRSLRSGFWVSEGATRIRDEASGLTLSIERGDGGQLKALSLTLPATRPPRPQRPNAFATGDHVRLILGERCWYPQPPAGEPVIVGGRSECLSRDGILLHWDNAGRMHTFGTATYLKRRPVTFEEILPLDTPLSDRAWGIRD